MLLVISLYLVPLGLACLAYMVLGRSAVARSLWPRKLWQAVPVLANGAMEFVGFEDPRASQGLVVDCTHPSALQLTHHKGQRTVPLDLRHNHMSSTDLVMNAIKEKHDILQGISHERSHKAMRRSSGRRAYLVCVRQS